MGNTPGPVDPFLKTLQGYSLFLSNFSDQSIFYAFREIDQNYEFCFFQKEIFTFRLGNSLYGPFPIALTSLVGVLFHFLDFNNMFYFFAILNLLLYFILYRNVKQYISIAFLCFFGLPFFIPNSEVSEHAILILSQILGYRVLLYAHYELRNDKKLAYRFYFLSGILFGSGAFLRHEVLLFGNFLIVTFILLQWWKYRNKSRDWKKIFTFSIGLYLAFFLFFAMNKFMYGSSVGPRLNANSSGLYSDYIEKLSFFKVILWKDGPNFGLFGNNTLFLITLFLTVYNFRKWNRFDLLMLFPALGLILFVPLLAPNDGGSPWGARYLFLSIYPLVYLSARVLFWMKGYFHGRFLFFLQFVFILSVLQTLSHEVKSLSASKEVSIQQSKYMSETSIEGADLIIFTSELVAMQTGINYIKYPVVLFSHENSLTSFQTKFLNKKEKFKEIVLIEPKIENINLSKFSKEDLEGIKPVKIIESFDKILLKTSIEEKELTIVHRYRNQK